MKEHTEVASQGGEVARTARKELEERIGRSVVTPLNAKKNAALNSANDDE